MVCRREKQKGYLVYLLLGSNFSLFYNGNLLKPKKILKEATKRLKSFFCDNSPFCYTKVVKTKPIGEFKDIPKDFYNQIVVLSTELSPMKVLAVVQRVEKELGRKRDNAELKAGSNKRENHLYESRSIDIDILQIFKTSNAANGCDKGTFKEVYRNSPKLQLPHPQIFDRPFVGELLKTLKVANNPDRR